MLFSVDEDVETRLKALSSDRRDVEQAAAAAAKAILAGKKIYVYGCGATGRLAKQMESAFWRPFWKGVKANERIWKKIESAVGADIEDRLIGEMTGGDRALISSLEGFEDLLLIGRLQLEDRGIRKGDCVICVTEGGETSSVIGTALGALDHWKAAPDYDPARSRENIYFIYNNPDERLLPFERSRRIIEEPGITRINLTTGPQAITGSTRMQATTVETYVIGTIVEEAVRRVLAPRLSAKEMTAVGFRTGYSMAGAFRDFGRIRKALVDAIADIVRLTDAEVETYRAGRFSTYFAGKGMVTVFTDATERSPTFRLFPLDTVKEPNRKCWIQVWTGASAPDAAWKTFLGRPFRGLDSGFYRKPFEEEIDDAYLRTAALESLKKAGNDQAVLYDFAWDEFNLINRGPAKGDLGVAVCLGREAEELARPDSYFRKFADLFLSRGARVALILVTDGSEKETARIAADLRKSFGTAGARDGGVDIISLRVGTPDGPFGIKSHIAAKMLLNAHSTAVMAQLGKVVGNTMTNVSPSNLKLIGRATYLIQSHVNDVLGRPEWIKANGRREPISYGEANAVLFDSIAWVRNAPEAAGQTAEVALSVIRILESIKEKRGLSNDEAFAIVRRTGLAAYLAD